MKTEILPLSSMLHSAVHERLKFWGEVAERPYKTQLVFVKALNSYDSSFNYLSWGGHIAVRFTHLVASPLHLVAGGIDQAVGIGAGLVSVCTGGLIAKKLAMKFLQEGKMTLSESYLDLLHAINPKAEVVENGKAPAPEPSRVFEYAETLTKSKNLLVKQVASRALFFLDAVLSIFKRAFGLIIGVIALIASLVTLGIFPTVNNFAYAGLKVFGVFEDLHRAFLKVVNPSIKI
jgi:hypothetical protein